MVKETIGAAGIDTTIFKAHSVRGASTPAASNSGITTGEIHKAAEWSTESSFQRFYYKPFRDISFAKAVQTTPLMCETEPSEI